jgi:FixJ family two-component response regulator
MKPWWPNRFEPGPDPINSILLLQAELQRGLEETRAKVVRALAFANVLRDTQRNGDPAPNVEMAQRIAALSARQRAVFERVVRGEANKVIAFELGLSTKTVETHRSRVMTRLGAQSLPELVRIADRAGVDRRR